jgi:hypothetical protein
MATWTNLPNTAVGVGGLPSGTTVTALRDNPVAIAEGAAGAPRVMLPAIVDALAAVPLGSLGSYALLRTNIAASQSAANPGTTFAGSALRYTNANGSVVASPEPVGTWRLMGFLATTAATGTVNDPRTSLFLRIV